MQRSIWDKLRDHPIMLVWGCVWFVVAMLNFGAGIKTGGFALALAFVSIAMLGAYAAKEAEVAEGGRRVGLCVLIVTQLVLGQWAGWQTFGLNLNSNATGLDSQASTHNTAAEDLARAKAERAALGTPRAIDAIKADEHHECASGVGPLCTGFRRELANAERAADLDVQIPALVKQLGQGPQLSNPNAPYAVAQAFGGVIASWISGKPETASRDDVIFWFSIFVTAVLEFVGTCGPWLFQFGAKWAAPEPPKPAYGAWDFGPRRITYQQNIQGGVSAHSAPHAVHTETGSDRHGDFVSDARGGPSSPRGSGSSSAGDDGLHQPLQTSASVPASQQQSGAPITVNLYGQPNAPQPTPLVPVELPENRTVAALREVTQRRIEPAVEQSVREAPDVPVDNSELNALLHGLNVFAAKCLVKQPGSWVEAAKVYAIYRDWAQERACSEASFHSLFPAVSGVRLHLAGDVPHYAGIALKRLAIAKEAS